jgi:hypothetical protein
LRRDELPPHDASLPRPHWDDLSFLELFFVERERSRPNPAADSCPADAKQCGDFGRGVLGLCVDRCCELTLHLREETTSGRSGVEPAYQSDRCAFSVEELGQLVDVAGREQTGLALPNIEVRHEWKEILHRAATGKVELFLRRSQSYKTRFGQDSHPLVVAVRRP